MNLPPVLAAAITDAVNHTDVKRLTDAATELSDAYRAQRPIGRTYMTSDVHRLAYATVRLPATYAAVHASLRYTADVLGDRTITSCLDLGAGPGTAMWAASQIWPSIDRFTLVEQDADLIQLGRELSASGPEPVRSADWQNGDLTSTASLPPHDLVICAYAVGELSEPAIERFVAAAWSATQSTLVIIEPGTMPGFDRIRTIRSQLLASGAHMVAPCPHTDACPISDDDWCHFSQRLDRSSLHRQVKAGEMGHEDEKFSYVAVSKQPVTPPDARVIRHPQRRSGHAHLSLCTAEGIQQQTVTRSQKPDWKRVRRLSWGDAW